MQTKFWNFRKEILHLYKKDLSIRIWQQQNRSAKI